MKTYKIDEITKWEINRPVVQAYADKGEGYEMAYANACHAKELLYTVGGRDLPFLCEAETREEALAKYAELYANEAVVPTEAHFVEGRMFTVTLQIDGRIDINVFAENLDSAVSEAKNSVFDMKDVEFIDSHVVSGFDHENRKHTDLY